ncbi:MAG: VanZ family protein, partial [Erysipelotrichaceae bacterium]|nr:VanZ family protein [Erysipelotrichaceae bacterium]
YKEETVLNILLFIPFGFLHKLALHKPWWNTLVTGCLFSIMIEFIQPLISLTRVCDITDIITNTCGCSIGILLATLYIQKKK